MGPRAPDDPFDAHLEVARPEPRVELARRRTPRGDDARESPRTAWRLGGSVVAVHDLYGDPVATGPAALPLGATVELDVSLDDTRPTSQDPCGRTSAGDPPPGVHTRIDYGLAPDREFRISGRLGDYTLIGRDWERCGITCKSGPFVDAYAKTQNDPLFGWLPDRQRRETEYYAAFGCEEDVLVHPPECSEPFVDPANPAPLDTLILSTGFDWRVLDVDGAEDRSILGVLLQGGGASFDPTAPLARAFDFDALRTRRLIAQLRSAPSLFYEIDLDRLEKIEWQCRRPFFAGDVNGDGAVDDDDEARILENVGSRYVSQPSGDVDCSGLVDEHDLAIARANRRPPLVAPEPGLGLGLAVGVGALLGISLCRGRRDGHDGHARRSTPRG